MPIVPSRIVWPSGGAWSISRTATVPAPPVLFSTRTDRPALLVSSCARMRATMSRPPPGGVPTRMRSCLDGIAALEPDWAAGSPPPRNGSTIADASCCPSVDRFQDRHDLLRRVDRARIAEGPVVEHAVGGDALQILMLDADVAQPARQAEARDEAVEH